MLLCGSTTVTAKRSPGRERSGVAVRPKRRKGIAFALASHN
jgi:hypothetical protein